MNFKSSVKRFVHLSFSRSLLLSCPLLLALLILSCQGNREETIVIRKGFLQTNEGYNVGNKKGKSYYIFTKLDVEYVYSQEEVLLNRSQYQEEYKKAFDFFSPDPEKVFFPDYVLLLEKRYHFEKDLREEINRRLESIFHNEIYPLEYLYKSRVNELLLKDPTFETFKRDKLREYVASEVGEVIDSLVIKLNFKISTIPSFHLSYNKSVAETFRLYADGSLFFKIKPLLGINRLNTPVSALLFANTIPLQEFILTFISYTSPEVMRTERTKLQEITRLALNDWLQVRFPNQTDYYIFDFLFESALVFQKL